MPHNRYDIVAIGNAIVDVLAATDDQFLSEKNITKGSMQLIDADSAETLYQEMNPSHEISGGSAANTLVGVAALGGRCAFIGQVANDPLGQVFQQDIRAQNIHFDVPVQEATIPTGRCLILVSPDGERSMNTFLGVAQTLHQTAIKPEVIENAEILYLEGYLWDPEVPRSAMKEAIQIARKAGKKVALTLSDTFCIERHREDFKEMINNGLIDILFANEGELRSLVQHDDLDRGIEEVAAKLPLLVVTKGPDGAIAVQDMKRTEVSAKKIDQVVDTTGAGDLFAAGFLAGQARNLSIAASLEMGAIAAAEIISHYGARPENDIKTMIESALNISLN